MTIAPISIRTKWEDLPVTVRPPLLTTCQKIGRVVWNILSVIIPVIGLFRLIAYGLGVLARKVILPSTRINEEDKTEAKARFTQICQLLNPHYEIIPHTIYTPDGAALDATLFRHRQADAGTPTSIYFQPNLALKESGSASWLHVEALRRQTPSNFVVFNYRSVGNSTGTFAKSGDLLVDGASVVHWVKSFTQVDKIHLYGYSLGGAVALKTMAADHNLTGTIVNERSFSSLEDWIRAQPLNCIIKAFAIWILKNQEMELNVADDLQKLKGRLLVVFHRQDPVIPYEASLARKTPNERVYELNPAVESDNHHCLHLQQYPGAKERVANFVFA